MLRPVRKKKGEEKNVKTSNIIYDSMGRSPIGRNVQTGTGNGI